MHQEETKYQWVWYNYSQNVQLVSGRYAYSCMRHASCSSRMSVIWGLTTGARRRNSNSCICLQRQVWPSWEGTALPWVQSKAVEGRCRFAESGKACLGLLLLQRVSHRRLTDGTMTQPQLCVEANACSSELTVALAEPFIMILTEVQVEKHHLAHRLSRSPSKCLPALTPQREAAVHKRTRIWLPGDIWRVGEGAPELTAKGPGRDRAAARAFRCLEVRGAWSSSTLYIHWAFKAFVLDWKSHK